MGGSAWISGQWFAFWFKDDGVLFYNHAVGTGSSHVYKDGTCTMNGREVRMKMPNDPLNVYIGEFRGDRMEVRLYRDSDVQQTLAQTWVRQR